MFMMHVTVGQVLELDIFQSSQPVLVSSPAPNANDQQVRWMHILETARPEGLLPGGEFILTTATFLEGPPQVLEHAANQFLDAVESTGAVAVAAEILAGREDVVEALTHAAKHRQIPVYVLHQRIRFVELMQQVHEKIASARLAEVETDRRIHEAFTRLSVGSASTDRIISEASALLGCPVIWEATEQYTEVVPTAEHEVVAGDETLGRLMITGECYAEKSLVKNVLERAGQAVSISVLTKRAQQEVRRSMATALFYQLRGGTDLSDEEVLWSLAETFGEQRLEAVRWWPVVFRIWDDHASEAVLNRRSGVLLDVLEQLGLVKNLPILAARSEIGTVEALLPFTDSTTLTELTEATRTRLTARLRGRGELVVGVGSETASAKVAAERLVDAAQVAHVAQAYVAATGVQRAHFFAKDLGLRGLLATLKQQEPLVLFVAAEFAGLLATTHSRKAFEEQLDFIETVLTGGNKATIARSLHLSRPALYARISRLEQQLGYSFENDAAQRTATHVALLAYRIDPEAMYAELRQHI